MPSAELHKNKNGKFYAVLFLQKQVEKAQPKKECLGINKGVVHAVTRSGGYLGLGCRKLLKANQDRNAQRRKQGHFKKSIKTFMRQMLDREVKRAVRVAKALGWNQAI